MAAVLLKRAAKCRVKNTLLSLTRSSSFQALEINEVLVDRLSKLGIDCPSKIQEKAIPELIKGKNLIINAETGSGKTLCYLLPIVNKLINDPSLLTKPPYAVILLPTIELCHQVASVFKQISDPHMQPCIVSKNSKLFIGESYPVVLAMPSALLMYNVEHALSNTKILVTDEADFLITSGGKNVWTLLDFFKSGKIQKKKKQSSESSMKNAPISAIERQFVFAAATLPSRGKKASLNVLTKWIPNGHVVNTSLVHQKIPTLDVEYVKVTEGTKFQQLMTKLNELAGLSQPDDVDGQNGSADGDIDKQEKSASKRKDVHLRVLVFVNTAEQASLAYQYLTGKILDETSKVERENQLISQYCKELNLIDRKALRFWKNRCAEVHKGIPSEERLESLEKFKSGKLKALICTDIASRGLDVQNVSHVIQLDYATNSATVLHRTGRTARAGSGGKVINFITPNDEILARAIKAIDEDEEKTDYEDVFSRNKMLRRRIDTLPLAESL